MSKTSTRDDIWRRVDRRGPDDCWPWTGKTVNGYGRVCFHMHTVMAHRLVCEWTNGPPPFAGAMALHSCDTPPCCNPAHLRWGTHTDNMRDRSDRGRDRRNDGEHNPNSKLSDEAVRQIKAAVARGETQRAVARQHGVTQGAIGHVIRGRSWNRAQG